MAKIYCALLVAMLFVDGANSILPPKRKMGFMSSGLMTPHEHLLKDSNDGHMWFGEQRVDHFNVHEPQFFSQKYYVNATYWRQPTGPIFLLLGGEGPLTNASVTGHFMLNTWAQQHGAMVVAVEHRFYGESYPTADGSTSNLSLLTSQQALADFANFALYIRNKYRVDPSARLISFGGSYSGALSAWFREMYPDIVYAAYGTSGPVNAKFDFNKYMVTVQDVIGEQCASRINASSIILEGFMNTQHGRQYLQQFFNTCEPIVTEKDVQNFYSNIFGNLQGVVQYNNDNVHYLPFNVTVACSILSNHSADPVESLRNFNNIFNNGTCTEVSYKKMIAQMQNSSMESPIAPTRSWTYQTCTEFAYFQTDEGNTVFPRDVNINFYTGICEDVFNITANIDTTYKANEAFGGLHLNASRVVLPNGSGDPWHNLGILKSSPSLQITSVYMDLTAHCADMYPPSPHDRASLTAGRAQVTQWLASMLQ
jgi:hypothetical protein